MKTRLLSVLALFLVGACAAPTEDDGVTNDANEIVEGQSYLEKDLTPPVAVPATSLIGKNMTTVLADATAGTTAGAKQALRDGCTLQTFRDAKANRDVAERETCRSSDIITVISASGGRTVYSDLDKDGRVDQFSGKVGAVVLYADADFDGKVDRIVERVDLVEDFSLAGYEKGHKKSEFIHRVREDKNRDGKFDLERIVARTPIIN